MNFLMKKDMTFWVLGKSLSVNFLMKKRAEFFILCFGKSVSTIQNVPFKISHPAISDNVQAQHSSPLVNEEQKVGGIPLPWR